MNIYRTFIIDKTEFLFLITRFNEKDEESSCRQ